MDLLESLRARLNTLPEGDHSPGLRAVLVHVEAAFKHLARAQESADESLFTDAIYRTNQAFEGSIKEAYRVLAGSDPGRIRPFDVEHYLEQNGIFRSRVLAQFRNYRQEWRNPSTHDYTLVFDESEAFLAIISVSAFAYLLFDEIAEKLSSQASQAETETAKEDLNEVIASGNEGLLDRVRTALVAFAGRQHSTPRKTEAQQIGALSGFFATLMPDLIVEADKPLGPDSRAHADLVVGDGEFNVIIELKRAEPSETSVRTGLAQLANYMSLAKAIHGVLFYVSGEPGQVEVEEVPISRVGGYALVMKPKPSIETR
jgi:hypothetical protein